MNEGGFYLLLISNPGLSFSSSKIHLIQNQIFYKVIYYPLQKDVLSKLPVKTDYTSHTLVHKCEITKVYDIQVT